MAAVTRALLLLAALCLPALANIPSHVAAKPHLGPADLAPAAHPANVAPNALIAPGLCGCLCDEGKRSRSTGKERDAETGLDYFGARYMSSAQGRFTSPDIPFIDQHPTDPQSWNLYSYVRNNPLIFADPTGNDCVYVNSTGNGIGSIDNQINSGDCGKTGGYWVDGTVTNASFAHGSLSLTGTTNGTNRTSASYGLGPDPLFTALQSGILRAEKPVTYLAVSTAVVAGSGFGGMLATSGGTGMLGLELIESQVAHIQAIETAAANHITMLDVIGASRETAGQVIRTGQKVWNHRQELIETYRNLKTTVQSLRGSLGDPRHNYYTRQVVQQAIERGESLMRAINSALWR